MSGELRILEGEDDVLEIVFNRPDQGNVLTVAMGDQVLHCLGQASRRSKAVLLRGEGADFCAGRESPLAQIGPRATAADLRRNVAEPVLALYSALRAVPVPVVAAVRGRAFGVGCAIAALADLPVAADDALFAIPEMDRDIPPTLVMTALADRLPRAALARLVLLREPIGAEEARAIGLAGTVVATAALDEEVTRLRAKLASNTRPVLEAVKSYLSLAPEMSYAARRDYAALANATAMSARFRD